MTGNPTRAQKTQAMKEDVRSVARRLFAEQGFSSTGVRQIAGAAGVDPTNVVRYFGSKEGLFLETMVLPDRWADVLQGPIPSLAADYLRLVIAGEPSGEGGAVFAALMRASDRREVSEALRSRTQNLFGEQLAPRLSGPDSLVRAHLFAAAMTGIQVALWVSDDPVLGSIDIEELIAAYAPSLQLILTPSQDRPNVEHQARAGLP